VEKYGSEVDVSKMEKLFSDPLKNELFSSADENDLSFHNNELDIFYERVPLISSEKKSGFLFFCDKKSPGLEELRVPGVDLRGKSLPEILESIERHIVVDAIRKCENLNESAEMLKLTRPGLNSKIKKFSIEINKN